MAVKKREKSLPGKIHTPFALEAILRCNQLIEEGKLPKPVSGELDVLAEKIVDLLCIAFGDGHFWEHSKKDAKARRALSQIGAIRRIIRADDHDIPTEEISRIAHMNHIGWPETHGMKMYCICVGIAGVVEFTDVQEDELKWWARRVIIKECVEPFQAGVKEELESETVWKKGKLNTIQSLACSVYRRECERSGVKCPNNENLKKYLQTVIGLPQRSGYFEQFLKKAGTGNQFYTPVGSK